MRLVKMWIYIQGEMITWFHRGFKPTDDAADDSEQSYAAGSDGEDIGFANWLSMIFQDGIRCLFQVSQLNILAVSPWFFESRSKRFALVTVVLQHFLTMPELANRFSQVWWKDSSFFPGMTSCSMIISHFLCMKRPLPCQQMSQRDPMFAQAWDIRAKSPELVKGT